MRNKILFLSCFLASSCFGSVMFPIGGDGSTYHVDQMGASIPQKKKKTLETEIKKPKTLDTMQPSPKDIVPDHWPKSK